MVMPLPKNPGESAAAFAAREAAYLESLRKRGILGPKDKPKPVKPGRGKPTPVPTPVKPGRGKPTPVPVRPGKPVLYSGSGMKSGGMVKGKKK
jgi:hypothetical protein